MTPQQEANQFMAKLCQKANEMKKDFEKMSPKGKEKVCSYINNFFLLNGIALSAENILKIMSGNSK